MSTATAAPTDDSRTGTTRNAVGAGTARGPARPAAPAPLAPPPAVGRLRRALDPGTARGKLARLALAAVVPVAVAAVLWGSGTWPAALTVDATAPLDRVSDWIVDNRETHWVFLYVLLHWSNTAIDAIDGVYLLLRWLGWAGTGTAAVLLSWRAAGGGRRGLRVAVTTAAVFAACGLLGMWEPTMVTLALMAVSVAAAAALGVLLGLAAGLSDRVHRALRPVLDTMQVLPAFAYLLPFVLVFGIGSPAALFSTVIYAAPPMARLTAMGLRGADPGVLEASASLGASRLQRLRTARLPLARAEILLGLNQTIMMALSMVVIASVIGAGGLGDEVYQALATVDVGRALAAGIPIVLLAVWLDRTTAAAGERLDDPVRADGFGPLRTWAARAAAPAAVAAAVTAALAARAAGATAWPEGWTVAIARPVNLAKDWIVANLSEGVPVVGGTLVWAGNFTEWLLNPLRDGLQAMPWWSVLLLVAALARLVGTWRTAATATAAMAAVGVLGVWGRSLNTLSQVLAGLAVTLLLGIAVGVLAARVRWVERALRPVLDTLQTMPQFVYLIPVVALFNVGRAAAVAAAVVYALPAVVRITTQGLRQVDPAAMEAARSLGATGVQQLRQVQLPLARPALLLAVNQGVVLVLAVVIIGGMVGGGALGYDVVKGLSRGDLGLGLVAGTAIVCLGLVLDRVTQPAGARTKQ
ncbi:ABC transporter permease subunit [Streptomyces sp. HB2AG]|uniref:ABC transporter permease subunit n=1 Tax=Streptomyces sp. HB2AG TaxID=2983400 RepID=UPI003FA741B2